LTARFVADAVRFPIVTDFPVLIEFMIASSAATP
jgi:hypothetical protein